MSDKQGNDKQESPVAKMLLEMGPLIIFFAVNLKGEWLMERFQSLAFFEEPIFIATAFFMVAMTISLIASKIILKSLPIMPLISGVLVLVFGGLTLVLQDDLFIKMKPTIVNVMFGGALLIALAYGKPLLKYVFEAGFALTDDGWKLLSLRWGLFFLFLAVLNEVVWRFFSTDFWVAFKVWGVFPITVAFALCQLPVLKSHGLDDDEKPAA